MPHTHPPYPAEFRAEAARLARSSDKSIPARRRDAVAMRGFLQGRQRRNCAGCRAQRKRRLRPLHLPDSSRIQSRGTTRR